MQFIRLSPSLKNIVPSPPLQTPLPLPLPLVPPQITSGLGGKLMKGLRTKTSSNELKMALESQETAQDGSNGLKQLQRESGSDHLFNEEAILANLDRNPIVRLRTVSRLPKK